MIVVVLGKRKIWSFQIDEEDWGRVRGFRWHVDSLGYVAKLLNLPKARNPRRVTARVSQVLSLTGGLIQCCLTWILPKPLKREA
jgi:hypothetical protein